MPEGARRNGELDAWRRGRRLPRREVPIPPRQSAGIPARRPRSRLSGKKSAPALSLGAVAAGVRNGRQGADRPRTSSCSWSLPREPGGAVACCPRPPAPDCHTSLAAVPVWLAAHGDPEDETPSLGITGHAWLACLRPCFGGRTLGRTLRPAPPDRRESSCLQLDRLPTA